MLFQGEYYVHNEKYKFTRKQKELSYWIESNCFHPLTGSKLYNQACLVSLGAGI